MATLRAHVAVIDSDGATAWFGPGDEPPAWAAEQILNPDAWGDDSADEHDAPAEPEPESEPEAEPEPEPEPEPEAEPEPEPEPEAPAEDAPKSTETKRAGNSRGRSNATRA